MRIAIKEIHIRNFKGVKEQDLEFGEKVLISGGNRKGKTTIYDAYLWCIFGQTGKTNVEVRPLDANNNIVHKLNTSVCVVLNIGERDIKIERKLVEKWYAEGTPEEKLKGTETTCLIDDIPYKVRQYKEKLNALCDYEKWFMLSNINNFWSYKIDERRKLLISMAKKINEEEITKDYPIIYKGVIKEKRELSEIEAQYKAIKKKANDEISSIPSKVAALNAMKCDADFKSIMAEKQGLDAKISVLDLELQGYGTHNYELQEYLKQHDEFIRNMQVAELEWQDARIKCIGNIAKQIDNITDELRSLHFKEMEQGNNNEYNKKKLESLSNQFEDLKLQWRDVNETKFNYSQTDICPVCGRPYTEEMKASEYENAVAEFNKQKSVQLAKIQGEASEIKERMVILKGIINTYEQIDRMHATSDINLKEQKLNELNTKKHELKTCEWKDSEQYQTFSSQLDELEKSKPQENKDNSFETIQKEKANLLSRRDELVKELGKMELNKKIDSEINEMNAQSISLSQIIVDCNEALRQASEYKKAKINIISAKVNSYFSFVHWRFYEQNIGNDELKDVCIAIDENGIDYGNTNDGTVINMGVDVINGISKAFDIYVPLFVDRKESAESIVETHQQTIFLMCKYGEPLMVNNI